MRLSKVTPEPSRGSSSSRPSSSERSSRPASADRSPSAERSKSHKSPYDTDNIELIREHFQFHRYVEGTEHRGITLPQLQRIVNFFSKNCFKYHDRATPDHSKTSGAKLKVAMFNLYHLNDWLIKPATQEKNCSMVECLASKKQTPTWFVSHWWGEKIVDFVKCVKGHCEVRALGNDSPYWVCAYANRQHSLSQEIAADPKQTSFYKALLLSKGVLLVLDEKTEHSGPATPFKRIWCVFEEWVALETNKGRLLLDIAACVKAKAEVLTDGVAAIDEVKPGRLATEAKSEREKSFPLEIVEAGLSLQLQKAEASNEEDRVKILNSLAGRPLSTVPVLATHENYTKVNRRLHGIFAAAAWRQAVEERMVRKLKLPERLAADPRLYLSMDLSYIKVVDKNELQAFAMGLPPSLTNLVLNCRGCINLDDAGIVAMANALPTSLSELSLYVKSCYEVGDTSATALARQLPKALAVLDLDFSCCELLSDEGIIALAEQIASRPLHTLQLDFQASPRLVAKNKVLVTNSSIARIVSNLPRSLKKLELSVRGFTRVGDISVEALRNGYPHGLEDLELSFESLDGFSDEGVASVAFRFPSSVRRLQLCFSNCGKVTDNGVAIIANAIRGKLFHLGLEFDNCENVSDGGLAAVAEKLPNALDTLLISLQGCKLITDPGIAALAQKLPKTLKRIELSLKGTQVGADQRKKLLQLEEVLKMRGACAPAKAAAPASLFQPNKGCCCIML